MNLKRINYHKVFSDRNSILIIFFVVISTIILSNYIYLYEDELSLQDASAYIAIANDPRNYFVSPQQESMRIFPSLLVFILKIFGVPVPIGFKYLTYLMFIFLNLKVFYLFKEFELKNFFILPSVAILIYSNHSVIYSVFNYYQLIDLFTYIFILYFIQLNKNENLIKLLFVSLISILTKEYLLVLVLLTYFNTFKKNKNYNLIIHLLLILFIFFFNYVLAGSESDIKNTINLYTLILSYLELFYTFYDSIINCLFVNRNIFLFLPFGILLFSKKFISFLVKNYPLILFSFIPISFALFLFNMVGNNFFRVFYHGYFIIIFYGILFLNNIINKNKINIFLFFISPLFFLIDFAYILSNINQSGFFNYFQYERYQYYSGFYFFNFTIIIVFLLNFKKIFYDKK
jgi:hypothetical protein|tara:strand:- start:7859 stop:9064 length:1206 start_codon:yes stop_codon:yes gene_type:complete